MIREIGRIVVSVILLGIVAFLYCLGFTATETALQLGVTNLASVIVGAEITYWFKPS